MELTTPFECLFAGLDFERNEDGAHMLFEHKQFLSDVKNVFLDSRIAKSIMTQLENLLENEFLDRDRLLSYKEFMLQSASLKKVDVGTKAGGELFSVHGSWRDFVDDPADKIVLTHVNPESLEPKAIESVGHVSKFGTVQNLIESSGSFLGDLYKGKFISILCRAFSEILDMVIFQKMSFRRKLDFWVTNLSQYLIKVVPMDRTDHFGFR